VKLARLERQHAVRIDRQAAKQAFQYTKRSAMSDHERTRTSPKPFRNRP
jgi:hypothetical protein